MDKLSQVVDITNPVLNTKKKLKSFEHSKVMNEMREAPSFSFKYVRKEKITSVIHELDETKACHESDISVKVNINILWC